MKKKLTKTQKEEKREKMRINKVKKAQLIQASKEKIPKDNVYICDFF